MQVGKLYKVIIDGTIYPQIGDIVVFERWTNNTKKIHFVGTNLKTMKQHQYHIDDMEALCR